MINNHVVSAQWAQALKDAGYPQDSTQFKLLPETEEYGQGIVWEPETWKRDRPVLAAPLATELLEQLPDGYVTVNRIKNGQWMGVCILMAPGEATEATLADTAADALAELWIIVKQRGDSQNADD